MCLLREEAGEQAGEETYESGPALAMESMKGALCFSLKFSSGNLSP